MVKLLNFLDSICLPENTSFTLPVLKQNALKVEFNNTENKPTVYNGLGPPLPFAHSEVFNANIIHRRRLTSFDSDCKAVYEVTFDIEGSNFNFKAGDTIGIISYNDESEVNHVISHLNLTSKADLYYSITADSSVKGSKIPAHVPVKSTLRHVLTHCLDLRSILKKLFILALSKHTKDEKERRVLEYLCSKEGSTAYTNHVLNKGLCILDIFTSFISCKPPIEVLLTNLPRLLPRPYSIVNSGLNNNKMLTICFSVISINKRKGLTTGWLERIILNSESTLAEQFKNLNLESNPKDQFKILNSESTLEDQFKKITIDDIEIEVPIYLRKNLSMFSLPEDLNKPLILIGPGTGVAPFIGFLEAREHIKENNPEIKLGECWLFFGCRNPKLDFIYKDELNGFISRGILNKLSTAFSRIENTDCKYVQDLLLKNLKEIITLINNGALVYVCGDLKTMKAQVKEIFVKGFIDYDGMTPDEASAKLTELEKDKRYLVDAWC